MMLAFFGITLAAFLKWAFFAAVSTALAYTIGQLTQKDMDLPHVEPDELNAPTVRQGTKYTINFGTNWIENPVTAWWGDLKTLPIILHYTINKWGNNKRKYYVAGYNYAAGMDLILTQGQNDGVLQIKFGDVVAWPNPDDETQWQADGATSAVIDEPSLFGGGTVGGGVTGTIAFQYGGSTQTPDTYLVEQLGANISAGRGLTRAILRCVTMGTSAFIRPLKFLVKRTDILTTGETQWYPSKCVVNTYNLNAAHIIRECYTNTEWGFGISTSKLNDTSWTDAADTLYSEGFGLSIKWEDQNQTLGQFVDDVLRHINGQVFQNPDTGLFEIKLLRDDYVEGNLEEFDDSHIVSVQDYCRGTVYENPNFVLLQYWDTQNNKPKVLPEYNLAVMLMQNSKIIPYEVEYNGITDDTLARSISARERYELSVFPAKFKITAKRTMGDLKPGDVFKMVWAPGNILEMAVRVFTINYGSLNDGTITLNCMTDVFATHTAVFSEPPDTEWDDPLVDPEPAEDRLLMETPFWDIYNDIGLTEALALDDSAGYLCVSARRASGLTIDYELQLRTYILIGYTELGVPIYEWQYLPEGRGDFTPNGSLDSFMPEDADDITVDLLNTDMLSLVEDDSYCVIDNEILKVLSVNTSTSQATLARGCLDTVPAYHSGDDSGGDGARVWFASTASLIPNYEFTDGDTPTVKILPATSKGQLEDDTGYAASAFDSRLVRPYPPGNFKINGESYPSSFVGEPTISWSHRDRTQQLNEITEHSWGSIGPETNTTYTLQIYDENNSLVRTESGLTGTSYTYDWETEMSDCSLQSGDDLNSSLRFVLKSVREGYDSWQSYDLRVNRIAEALAGNITVVVACTGDMRVDYDMDGSVNISVSVVGDLDVP